MKVPCTLLALALTLVGGSLPAQESKQRVKPPSAEEQLQLTKPGIEHEKLARYAGTWDVEVSMRGSTNSRVIFKSPV